ncbi:MAG: hypothetical protein AB1861_23395 [Cyanobacteriota bacterium]
MDLSVPLAGFLRLFTKLYKRGFQAIALFLDQHWQPVRLTCHQCSVMM